MESIDAYKRSKEDIEKVIKLAKLNESDLNEITQVVKFTSESDDTSDIKLLELDSHLFKTIVKGECLTFRGCEEESVVLCSQNRTYDLQEAETSNSLLLSPNLRFAKQTATNDGRRSLEDTFVRGVFYTYYEVKRCKPRTEKVLELLAPSAFNGTEYEHDSDPRKMYNWERLCSEIQASEDELRAALQDYYIINLDGYLRSLTFEYETRALTMMLDLMDENSWALDEVDKETTTLLLRGLIPEPVFEAMFASYAELSGKEKPNGDPLYRYKEEKICRFLAKVLLAASPTNDYDDFMEAWQIGTPEQMHPKVEWLRGIALVVFNKNKNINEVISYPAIDLPEGINERFNELFKRKEKWTIEEISPYIADLTTDRINVNALLTKHSRASTTNGVKYYSSKHGK